MINSIVPNADKTKNYTDMQVSVVSTVLISLYTVNARYSTEMQISVSSAVLVILYTVNPKYTTDTQILVTSAVLNN